MAPWTTGWNWPTTTCRRACGRWPSARCWRTCSASRRRAPAREAPMTDAVRLAKRVAALVPCSRREAELYIEGGWVRVDGVVVEEPQHRVTDERIELDRDATLETMEPVTLLLHKPAGASEAQALRLLTASTRAAADHSGIR